MTIPVLITDRLVLRPHRRDDFEAIAAMWGHAQVVTHFGGKPFNREESWQRLLRYAGSWALLGYGLWAVTRKGDDRLIGDVGFLEGERTGVPLDAPESAWCFHPDVQGRGLASEAVQAALGWGAGRFARTIALINNANLPSIAVAHRCGFARYADATYRDAAMGLWEYRF